MQSLKIIPDPFDPKTWRHLYTSDIVETLQKEFSKFPKNGRLYHKQVCQANDITPQTEDEIDALRTMQGPFYAVVYPGDPVTLTYIAYAIIAVVAIVAITNRPKIPNAVNRNYQTTSPNNALQQRTNEARVNGRIPDIFGNVRSYPDLIALPYSVFINHQEYEYSYMCIGRGEYEIDPDTIRDGQTAVSKIDGEAIGIYGPNTSPNTGDAPFITIGDPIDTEVIATVRSKSVNGQVLLAPNEGTDTTGYNNVIAFEFPNRIIASSANTTPDFVTRYHPGDIIVVRTSQIFGRVNDFSAGIDTPIEGQKLVQFNGSNGTIEFDASTPLPTGNFGEYLEILDGNFKGKYFITGRTGQVLYLQTPINSNPSWAFTGTTSYSLTTFKRNDLIYIDFSGQYTIASVATRTITLVAPENSQINQSWVWMQGLDLGGGDDSYGHDGDIATIGFGSDGDGWVGPFVLDVSTTTQIIANFVALNGLYADNGSNQFEIDVDIQLEAALSSESGVRTGPSQFFVVRIFGSNATQSTRAATLYANLPTPGRYLVRARRLTPKDFSFVGTVVDEVKWRDVYSSSPIGAISFGNVTTIQSLTRATAQALAISERQLNLLVTRKLPARISGSTFGALTATKNAADIISFMCLDPKLGNRSVSEVNFDNIYDIVADVKAYFGNYRMAEFSYTFDNANLSFEDMISTVAQAVFCTAHRRGRVLELTFEKATDDSYVLFNHRNKIPGSETRTASFSNQTRNDGVEYDYVSPEDDAIVTYYLPEDKSAINPKQIQSVGVRSFEQAATHAHREYNRMKHQTRAVEFDALQEAEIVPLTGRIVVSDNTRPDIQDGQIEAQDGLMLTLSQPVLMLAGSLYIICLQLVTGRVEMIDVVPGPDPYYVILAETPSEDLSVTDAAAVKTLYQIVRATETDTRSFIVTEKDPQSNFVTRLTAINYDNRYYAGDLAYFIDEELSIWQYASFDAVPDPTSDYTFLSPQDAANAMYTMYDNLTHLGYLRGGAYVVAEPILFSPFGAVLQYRIVSANDISGGSIGNAERIVTG